MDKGTVKWFSPRIGAGFIRSEAGHNVFFNYNAILNYNQEIIYKGQPVSFDIVKNSKSAALSAARVKFVPIRHEAGRPIFFMNSPVNTYATAIGNLTE